MPAFRLPATGYRLPATGYRLQHSATLYPRDTPATLRPRDLCTA